MTPHPSQRGYFSHAMHQHMAKDKSLWMLTGDLGYGALDRIRDDYPERFLNVGAAEQILLGAGVGLALEGQKPFCYSITPFLLYRGFEWIRNYINHERAPVRLVGCGLDDDYGADGFTHHAFDAKDVLKLFPNIVTYFPNTKEEVPAMVAEMCENDRPAFICLRR